METKTTNNEVIRADALTKTFGKFTAVDRVSFSIGRGEIFGFLGPNGAGKSTTIRMLCGLLSSTAGTASVAGFDINRHPESVRQNIGYMSQKFSLYKDLTVAENMTFFGGVYGLDKARLAERTRAAVELAALNGQETTLTGNLSGAVQQRLALACAILHEPPVLFLDEPTSGVDPISRRRFWNLIQDMSARGVTVLITTHFLDEAEFCGRIGFIASGRLVAMDTPANLKRLAVKEDLFDIALTRLADAKDRIERIPGVNAVTFFGAHLHVFCSTGTHTSESLVAAIRATGTIVTSAERTAPTLEDVFVRLSSHKDTVN